MPTSSFAAFDPESGATSQGGEHRDDPRRYGFHATLKPPFALRDGATRSQLLAALSHFADEHAPFILPPLAVATLGDFIALRPVDREATAAGQPLRTLADDCVRLFDDFRALPPAAALAAPLRCDGVALFVEDAPGADFRLSRRFDFAR